MRQPIQQRNNRAGACRPGAGALRRGMTLYEVVLSIGIFLMAMLAISELISIGSRASVQAKLRTEAAMHAESKMAEVVAGYIPLQNYTNELLLENDSSWRWSLKQDGQPPDAGLKDLIITVTHTDANDNINASFTLRRWMRDPQQFPQEETEEEEESSSAQNQQSSSANTTGGTGQ